MTEQKFVGDKLVDEYPGSVLQKADDVELTRKEVKRDPAKQPGANKREGIASRNPAGRLVFGFEYYLLFPTERLLQM